MFSIVTKLKVMGVSVGAEADAVEDGKKVDLKFIGKTKWAPNVFIPMQKTFTLPVYTCAMEEELILFLEVWEKDSDWGLDKLVGLAQYDLKEKFLKCSPVKQDYTWLELRNPVSNKIGGKILLLVRVDGLGQQLDSVSSITASSYFPEGKSISEKRKPNTRSIITKSQSTCHDDVVRAAQLQLKALGITPTTSPEGSGRRDAKSCGSVQVDDIIEILNGKLGERNKVSKKTSNSSRMSQGQGDWLNANDKPSNLRSGTTRKEPVPESKETTGILSTVRSSGENSDPVPMSTVNPPASLLTVKPPGRRRMAANFTNMDYL